jgi:hypothetical protein
VGLVYDPRGLPEVTTARPMVAGVLQHDSRLNRIDRILIPARYTFFGSPPAKNYRVKRAWPGAILGWVTDREIFLGVHK